MSNDPHDILLAEYAALRSEIEKRSEMRYRLLSYAVLLLGTMITLVFQAAQPRPSILFAYPLFAYFFASLWVHNFKMTMRMSAYIIEHIQPVFGNRGWESFNKAAADSDFYWQSNKFSSGGIFVFAEITAILFGFSAKGTSPIEWRRFLKEFLIFEWVWFGVGVVAVIATIVVLRLPASYEARNIQVPRIDLE